MLYDRGDLAFLPIRPNDDFARRLANHFGIPDPDELVKNICYANGEYCPTITDILNKKSGPRRLSGRRACIVYSYTKSELGNAEAFARILLLSDAAYRAGAKEVYLIMAESLFDRQDLDPALKYDEDFENFSDGRKRKIVKMEGQSFSLRAAIKHFYEAGIKKVLTLDRHSEATDKIYERVYRCSYDHVLFNLNPVPIFVNHLLSSGIKIEDKGKNLVIVAPDKGAEEAVNNFYNLSDLNESSLVFCNKYRSLPNDPTKVEAAIEKTSDNFTGTENKIIIALDDKGDTLGTLQKTLVQGLTRDGKPKQIHAMLSHLILSTRSAYELISDNKINIHGSNSHPNMVFKKDEPGVDQITVIDFTPYFAWALVNHVIPGEPLPVAAKEDLKKYSELYAVAKQGRFVDFS